MRKVTIRRNTAAPWPRFKENEIAVLDEETANAMVLRGLADDLGATGEIAQPAVASPSVIGPDIHVEGGWTASQFGQTREEVPVVERKKKRRVEEA